jgi:hypothetical protein
VNGEAVFTPKGAETPVDKPVDNIVDTNPVNKPPVDSKPPVVDSKEQRRIYQREWLRNKRAGLTAISS